MSGDLRNELEKVDRAIDLVGRERRMKADRCSHDSFKDGLRKNRYVESCTRESKSQKGGKIFNLLICRRLVG